MRLLKRALTAGVTAALAFSAGAGAAGAACPPGHSHMGCSIAAGQPSQPAPRLVFPWNRGVARGQSEFPDVSSFQGHPNWAAARPFIDGAAVKAGEYHEDPDFAFNVAELKRLGIRWAPYWFVRNTGCAHEGAELVAVIRSVGGLTSGPVVLDEEVPEAAGYVPCLDAAVFAAFHRHAVIYTSPGTWPGGSSAGLGVWVAAYGPSSPPNMFGKRPLAWQFTDGISGRVTFIPGIGTGDVNIDYGLMSLQAAPPLPVCFSHRISAKACAAVKAKIAGYERAVAASQRVYVARGCAVLEQRMQWFDHNLFASTAAETESRARGLLASLLAFDRQSCGVFAARVGLYTSLIHQLQGRN
jgi:hypothetical protein